MITVEQVLHLDNLGLEPVELGDVSRSVAWVATSEVPDPTPYLNGGEILLFTGLTSPMDDSYWHDYVRRLIDRGVVALGLGVGDHLTWQQAPEGLAEAVRGTKLTLFTVPERTPFLGIIHAVADLRAADDRAVLEATLAHQRALTKAATAADGASQILVTLAALLPGSWTALCNTDAEILESSAPRIPALPSGRTLDELVGRLRGAGLRGSLSESGPDGGVIVHPLGVDGDPHGYLVVALPGHIENAQTATISTAVALLSLHVERTEEQRLARRRIRAGALALLLSGDVRAGDSLLRVAGDDPWNGSVLTVRAARLRGGPERMREALRRIEAHRLRTGHRMLAGTSVPDGAEKEDTVMVLENVPAVLAALKHIVEVSDVRAGIGGAAQLGAVAGSNEEATESLERTTQRQPIAVWDDFIARGVAGLLPAEPARTWARNLLEPLSSQGAAGERLLATLRVFLAHNGNRRQTAEELAVHRNTLLSHLLLVEAALQRSLDDPQVRADLWIALNLPNQRPGTM